MNWRITVTSPQLGQLERETPAYALLSAGMDLMFATMKAIKAAGVPVELTIRFEPLEGGPELTPRARGGGADKAS